MERTGRVPTMLGKMSSFTLEATPRVRALVLAPLIIRLALAAVFLAHGAQKLFGVWGGAGLAGTTAGFAAMGLKPAFFLAAFAAGLEFGGGILLVLGLLTRPIATLLAFEMIFALLAVHAPNGFFLNWACAPGRGHGIEYSLTLVASLIALALLGAGRLSFDASRSMSRRLGSKRIKPFR